MFELPSKDPNPLKPGLHKIDIFNENPLFVVNKPKFPGSSQKNYIVNNWEEAFSLHGEVKNINDINLDFIACLISDLDSTLVSPYRRIKRIPKANNVLINKNGHFDLQKYDFPEEEIGLLNKKQVHFRLRKELQKSIVNEIKFQKNNIALEHSSGLDSNTILSILLSTKNISKEKIHTFSFDNSEGELIERCRDYFSLSKKNIHVRNKYYKNERSYIDIINILGAPSFNKRCLERLRILKANNCEIMFSGLGGDQALSHHGMNALTDLVLKNDLKNIYKWTGNFNQSFKTYVGRNLLRILPKLKEIKINSFLPKSIFHNLLIDCLSNFGRELIYPRLKTNYHSEYDVYIKMSESIKSRICADHLSIRIEEEKRLANFYGIKKIFPLLNKKIIELIINQDPLYFSNKQGNGRLLLRESFKNDLPEFFQSSPVKYRKIDENILNKNIDLLRKDLQFRISAIDGFNEHLVKLWDLKKLNQIYIDYLSKESYLNRDIIKLDLALYTLESINYWFNLIDN